MSRGVLLAAGRRVLVGEDAAGGHAEGAVDAAHQLGLVLGEVVVDGDDVDALAGERVEVGRQRGDERLALTGLHLGDVAEVQGGAAHDLDVEVAHAEGAGGGLADGGEGLRQQSSSARRRRGGPGAVCFLAQFAIGEGGERIFKRVNGISID